MKKHLIAAAVAAAVAVPAMAQVTVYGIIDQGYTDTDVDSKASFTYGSATLNGKTSASTTTTGDGSAYTSQRLGFRGEEDLGGGLKAGFVYELGLADSDGADSGTDTATAQTVRQALLSLSGSFGTVKFGRMTTLADTAWGVGDVGGSNNFIGRAYTSGIKLNNSRSDRLVEYTSTVSNGLQFAIQYGKRDTKQSGTWSETAGPASSGPISTGATKANHKELGLAARYSAGPLNLMAGYSSEEEDNASGVTTQKPKQLVLAGNYNFGPARMFLTYADGSNRGDGLSTTVPNALLLAPATTAAGLGTFTAVAFSDSKVDADVIEVGVSIPQGAWTFNGSFYTGERTVKGDGALTGITVSPPSALTGLRFKTDLDGIQLAALYSFSKRTMFYAVYGTREEDTKGSYGFKANTETDQFGFGVRHSF